MKNNRKSNLNEVVAACINQVVNCTNDTANYIKNIYLNLEKNYQTKQAYTQLILKQQAFQQKKIMEYNYLDYNFDYAIEAFYDSVRNIAIEMSEVKSPRKVSDCATPRKVYTTPNGNNYYIFRLYFDCKDRRSLIKFRSLLQTELRCAAAIRFLPWFDILGIKSSKHNLVCVAVKPRVFESNRS